MLTRGLFKKFCSWPFSSDPKGSDRLNWEGTEREDFYAHLNKKEFSKALAIIKTKATRNSLDEMFDLMCAFERATLGSEIIVIEKANNEVEKK